MPRSAWFERWIYILFLIALGLYAYGDTVRLGFSYDDEDYIANARKAHQDLRYLVRPEIDAPWASRLGVHLYAFAVQPFFDDDPAPYHLANALLHLVDALLLMELVTLHLEQLGTGFAAALLFLLNCMHYRTVLWISAISLVLGMTFLLIAFLLCWRYLTTGRNSWLASAAFSFALSGLCHQGFAGAALLFPLLGVDKDRLRGRRIGPLLVFPLLGAAIVALERWAYAGSYTGQETYLLWGTHVLANLSKYLFGLFTGNWLEMLRIGPSLQTVMWGGGLIGIALLALLCYPPLRFWILWVLLTTLPFDLWNRPMVFSRYFYLPAVGSAVIMAVGLSRLEERIRGRWGTGVARGLSAIALTAVVLTSLPALARLQSAQYCDEGKYQLFERQAPGKAIPSLEEALRRDPNAPDKVWLWLAWACYKERDYARAEEALRSLLERNPDHVKARQLLGQVTRVRREGE